MWNNGRDPDRIKRILDKLKKYWSRMDHTDLRLCQIIVNMTGTTRNSDIFFVEDDVLERALDKALQEPIFEAEI